MAESIVIGVIGADCHAVGNKVIESHFSEAGFNVVNLGVMVSQDEFIDAAMANGSRAILVSSLYGHGEIDCEGFRDRCVEKGLSPVLLYVGGNLVVGKNDFSEVEKKYLSMGFNRVFPPGIELTEVVEMLRNDLLQLGK